VVVDVMTISRWSGDSLFKHLRNVLPVSCLVAVASGSSYVSASALATSSSSSRFFRQRSADRALKRVIAKSQMETADRHSNLPA
jgi:hypothetical protein